MLTDKEIDTIIQTGAARDADGDLSGVGLYKFARAIEQAATAPLLARITELEVKLAEGALAVRWSPGSAYWSNELRRIFGPEAREGIDTLEARLRKAQDAAEAKLAEKGTLLRQALDALEDYAKHLENADAVGGSTLQAVVSLPWRIDQDNDKGLCVVDAREEIVYVEDWGGIPDEMSSGMREQIIEQARANARFMVAASVANAPLEPTAGNEGTEDTNDERNHD